MLTINPKDVSTGEFHSYLLGAVSPRPIAFASTIDKDGNVNLSPFSFFNVFSANPPIMIFSPARRVRGNSTKHTLENCLETKEVVINIVNFDMVEQMSLSSTEYAKGVNEFTKSGLTEVKSTMVKPPRVGESPVSFECKVNEVITLGENGGAGNLIICEVLLAHFKDEILDDNKKIDPFKLDAVARLGGNWYARINGEAIFEIPKPVTNLGVGYDAIPEKVRNSDIFTGNDLGRLGNIEHIPSIEDAQKFVKEHNLNFSNFKEQQLLAQTYLRQSKVEEAWKILMT